MILFSLKEKKNFRFAFLPGRAYNITCSLETGYFQGVKFKTIVVHVYQEMKKKTGRRDLNRSRDAIKHRFSE